MSNKDISQKLNHLRTIAVFGKHQFMDLGKGAFVRIFGFDEDSVSFIAVKNVREFENITTYLYNSDVEISINYSFKTFQNKIADLLRSLNKEKSDIKKTDWENFKSKLNSQPVETVKVFAPIYGITMNQEAISFGDFTIYHPDQIKTRLEKEYPKVKNLTDKHVNFDGNYKIGVEVKARDIVKCQELAHRAFSSFENVANFVMSTFHKTKRIGVLDYSQFKKFETFLLSIEKVTISGITLEHFETVHIDDPIFQDPENGNAYIWNWITTNKNDLQQKIMDSIEWYGKAVIESDDSKALLQYIISIEALLQYDEGKLIVPSIVSQLCDMIAYLLGKSFEERVSYAENIKELYKIRSSITHSGKSKISNLSLHTAQIICHMIIRKIITTEPYKNFQSKKSLCDYLIKLKYGATE
ncbi:HEPN domain-containing protein [Sediminibacterium sp. C3]|uniref:HEPN domain-containing protein n=1 Tax=Sediminibacterium sp. C3 TaxID=1267211 RepID=UPI0003F8A880|nr:HEPN domain-containing protein [Sediminibacterium sp. C3]